jgi:hypothetical protein
LESIFSELINLDYISKTGLVQYSERRNSYNLNVRNTPKISARSLNGKLVPKMVQLVLAILYTNKFLGQYGLELPTFKNLLGINKNG